MATLTFSFDTGNVPLARIVDAIATVHNYQAQVVDTANATPENPAPMIPNPESKAQFARRMIKEHIIEIVRTTDVDTAIVTARNNVQRIDLT